MSSVTANEQMAASTTFSATSVVRETSPRTRRPNACSSRSSASIPAASSTVTNMSEIVTATAIANRSSGVEAPFRTVRLTFTGSPIAPEDLAGQVEVVDREAREADDLVQRRTAGVVGREVRAHALQHLLGPLQPQDVEARARGSGSCRPAAGCRGTDR